MEGLNFIDYSNSDQSLFVNKNYLAILSQITIIRIYDEKTNEKTRNKIFNDWKSFLLLIESKIEKKSTNEG